MKEIGETLKETREEMGISLDEVASDLKLKVSQLENVEEGNIDVFKDVFSLKYIIQKYAQYLGLDYEEMVDEFNEYLFDRTSKISIDDIRKTKKKMNKKKQTEEKRIASPYTMEKRHKISISPFVFYIGIVIIVFFVSYFIFSHFNIASKDNDEVAYSINK